MRQQNLFLLSENISSTNRCTQKHTRADPTSAKNRNSFGEGSKKPSLGKSKVTHDDSLEARRCHPDILQCRCNKHHVSDTVHYDTGTGKTANSSLHIHNTDRSY